MVPTPSRSATIALISPSRWREISTLVAGCPRRRNGARKCWPCHMPRITGTCDSRLRIHVVRARTRSAWSSTPDADIRRRRPRQSAGTGASRTRRLHQRHASARRQRRAAPVGLGIEQPMQMDDEVAHVRIVDGLLRLRLPGGIGGCVVRVNADDVELVEILELDAVEIGQLAAENEVKQLRERILSDMVSVLRSKTMPRTGRSSELRQAARE